jgi:hypothetical protein
MVFIYALKDCMHRMILCKATNFLKQKEAKER